MGLLLIGAIFLTYLPVWHAGFIWGDDGRITANPCVVGPLGLMEIWTTKAADICPLVITTFWFEHALWGVTPLPYHLVNILLHAACAILLWRVLRSLQVPGAWLGAALWALHPVQVETVAWVTEMKNTQSGLFYLLTLLFFIRCLRVDSLRAQKWTYAWTLLFAALALASKSSIVMLPLALGLCVWWIEGRWHWRNLARLAPIAVMAVFPTLLTFWTQKLQDQNQDPPSLQFARSFSERFATTGDAVWFYLGKLLWPHPLIFIYPRWEIDPTSPVSYVPLLAVIAILILLVSNRKAWPRGAFFAFAYFIAALLPVLGLVDGYFWRYSLVSDHFQYLASMGPLAFAGAALHRLSDFVLPQKRGLQASMAAGLLLILGTVSWQRTAVFQSNDTLWRTTIAQNPTCWMAYNNLGGFLSQTGQYSEAIEQYEQASKIKPDYAGAHSNLGAALEQTGNYSKAIEQYEQALKIKPDNAAAHDNLGITLMHLGRVPEAIKQYEQALKINPDDSEAHSNLGDALQQTGHVPEAIEEFEQALKIKPDNAVAHNNLGVTLIHIGRMRDAHEQYEEALKINPDYAEAHYNLGNDLIRTGHVSDAIEEFYQALKIKPDYVEAHSDLGCALQLTGHLPEAIEEYEHAIRINPNYAPAQSNLARARALQTAAPAQK